MALETSWISDEINCGWGYKAQVQGESKKQS